MQAEKCQALLIHPGAASETGVSLGAQLAKKGILGFTVHGTEQMVSRGFTNEAVLKIVTEGVVKEVVYRGAPQIHYVLGQYRVAVEITGQNAGKIITIMGDWNVIKDGVRGIFTGF